MQTNNYEKIINDTSNYAIETNKYLEQIKVETDKEKRFNLLKKYFTENITKNLYHNMDLLNTAQIDFDQFKNMYVLIAKDLFLNILLASDTLISEKHAYCLDTSQIDACDNIISLESDFPKSSSSISISKDDSDNEYSICQSYIAPNSSSKEKKYSGI